MNKRIILTIVSVFSVLFVFSSCANKQPADISSTNVSDSANKFYEGFEYNIVNNSITITKYTKNEIEINVPDKIENVAVTSIATNAFYNNKNTVSITLPDTIQRIEDGAFYRCYSLKEFYIPKSVNYIGGTPFFRCTSLEKIVVDEDNLYFESLDGVLYNKGKTKIIEYPEGKKDEIFQIPSSVTAIDGDVFGYHCKYLKKLIIPSSVVNFPNYNIFTYPEEITVIAEKDSNAYEYAQKYQLKISLINP